MLLPEGLNEKQLIALRKALRADGLQEKHISDVMLLLWTKSHTVQLAFFHRACGLPYSKVAAMMSRPLNTVHYWVNESCADILKYIRWATVKATAPRYPLVL